MRGKGAFVLTMLSFLTLCLYFGIFGFSRDIYTKWGQYAAMIALSITVIDAYFRD